MENDLERGWRRVRELVEWVERGNIVLCSEDEMDCSHGRYPYSMVLAVAAQNALTALGYPFPPKGNTTEGGEQA